MIGKDRRILIIGAGPGGIISAYQFREAGYTDVKVLERDGDVGGTWQRSRYPGLSCDVMIHAYSFSFNLNPSWPRSYASQPEILEYLRDSVDALDLWPMIHLNTGVSSATWNDDTAEWDVTTSTGETLVADIVISAQGMFGEIKWPDIAGRDSFSRELIHTGEWPHDLDITGKRVAVIGNGSTGVQLLGRVTEMSKHVTMFQRTPQWISPRDKYGKHVEPESRWLINTMPGYWNWCRITSIMHLFDFDKDFLIRDEEYEKTGGQITAKSDFVRNMLLDYIKSETGGRQDLIDKLIPDYAPMVRRPIVDNGWYRALTRDNVELVTEDIVRFTDTGMETADGVHHDLDVVISATGYDIVKYLWPAEYFGRNGVNLHEKWEEESPMAYVGMMVPGFPNLFTLYGPNSQPVSGGVALPAWYQMWAGFVARCLIGIIEQGKQTVEVTDEAFRDYNEKLVEESQKLIMVTEEASAKKNYYVQNGRMQVNAPWETCDYYRMTSYPDPEAIIYQ